MKTLSILVLTLFAMSTFAETKIVEVEAFKSIELTYLEFKTYNVKIINISSRQINVSVNDIESGEQIKGFGLSGLADAIVSIEDGRLLKFSNPTAKTIKLKLQFIEKPKPTKSNDVYVTFTMRNSSAKSIPLMIPGVMNPNLTAFSNSGVNLKIGQEVLFRYKGKTEILMIVSDEIKSGDKLDVAEIIKNRKKELDR